MTANHTLLIERREYKYLITEELADQVRHAIRPFCRLDPFAAKQPRDRYTISSLYFDTPALALYHANIVEHVDRFKLRIRNYPDAPDGPVFFEVKRRVNDVISKARGRVPLANWEQLFTSPSSFPWDKIGAHDRSAVERFMTLARSHVADPVTLVRYEREPYMSLVDDYARVTFDRNIRSQRLNRLSLEPDNRHWRNMDDAYTMRSDRSLTVLELKFTSAVPTWMVNVVASLGLNRLAFSKYETSVVAWYTLPDFRLSNLQRNIA